MGRASKRKKREPMSEEKKKLKDGTLLHLINATLN